MQVGFKYKLKALNVKYGKGIVTYNAIPDLHIEKKGVVEFGRNFTINNFAQTSWFSKTKIVVKANAKLHIGNDSGINGSLIVCSQQIHIGNHVEIGGGTRVYDTNFHSLNYTDRHNPISDKTNTISSPVIIEDDVFIGTGCIIGKGVTIGARSIIAAGSIVVKSIPSDTIAGGNPCKIIKNLKE